MENGSQGRGNSRGAHQDPESMSGKRDAALIAAAAFVRSTTIGVTGVTLAIHLAALGLTAAAVGVLIGAGLAGAATATLAQSVCADRIGRRRTLIALATLTALGFVAIALTRTSSLMTLAPIAFFGMLNGMGRDRGAAAALDQAILPGTTSEGRRTWMLAWYNVSLDAGHALGALGGAVPGVLSHLLGMSALDAHRVTFLVCAVAIAASIVCYALLTDSVELKHRTEVLCHTRPGQAETPVEQNFSSVHHAQPHEPAQPHAQRAHALITRLTLLFGLDSLGGGFLNTSLVAYWFFERFAMSEGRVALLFFAARVLNAASHVAAAWLAKRIGLVNTMVFTHIPSSLLLLTVPFAPTFWIAAVLFLLREGLVEMDVPTRQSYVMAVVRPEERTFASGVTNLVRVGAWAVAPGFAGLFIRTVTQAAPLFIGAGLKIVYDIALYAAFRRLKPPEERSVS
jgi:MFS family permease